MTLTRVGHGLWTLSARLIPSGRVVHDFSGGVRRDERDTWDADILLRYDGRPVWPIFTRVDLRRGALYWRVVQEVKERDWILRVRTPAGQVQRAAAEVDAWRVDQVDPVQALVSETRAPEWLLDRIPWSELSRTQSNRDCPWAMQRLELLKISIPYRQTSGAYPEPAGAIGGRT